MYEFIKLLDLNDSIYFVLLDPTDNKVEMVSNSLLKISNCSDYRDKQLKDVVGCLSNTSCANSAVHIDMSDTDKVIHMLECSTMGMEFFVIKTKVYKDGNEKHLLIFTDTGDYSANTKLVKELDSIYSHEMRNALNNLNLVNQTLKDSYEISDFEDFHENIQVSVQTAMVMEKILGTYESLKKSLLCDSYRSVKGVSLYETLREIAEDQSALARNKSLSVTISTDNSSESFEDYTTKHNKGLIYLLFSNLVNNAFKYSTNGSDVYLHITKSADSFTVSVKNHGSLDEIIRENFFSRYVRGTNSEGTGYGTYCSKVMTDLFKGDIRMNYENNIIDVMVTIPF